MHRHCTTYSDASSSPPMQFSLSLLLNNKIIVIPHTLISPLTLAPPPTPTLHMGKSKTKWKRMSNPTISYFLLVEKDIQNKADWPIGSAGTEDCHFRELFGMGPFVVAKLWILMPDHKVILPGGEIKHLLWTLHFLKAYLRQAAVCSTVGGSTCAIYPKTLQNICGHLFVLLSILSLLR